MSSNILRVEGLKPRELRRKVVIEAQMRIGAAWGEVCLLNLSSRGALARSAEPPPKGTYVEFRRGSHVIVACVMWAEKHRFGVRTQDPIRVDDLISDPDGSSASANGSAQVQPNAKWKQAYKRPAGQQHEQSRMMARSMEFCILVGSGVICAGVAFALVQTAVSEPMSQISEALTPR